MRLYTIFCIALIKLATGADDWSYENTAAWGENYPSCNGNKQSPVDLSNVEQMSQNAVPQLDLINYKRFLSQSVVATNDGHSVSLRSNSSISTGTLPLIRVKTNDETRLYIPDNIHFHWGDFDKPGAEHLVHNTRYDVEMHIVHRNLNAAQRDNYGFAVLALLWRGVDRPKRNYSALRKIFEKLPQLQKYNSTAKIQGNLQIEELLSSVDYKNYYAYQGSLTTPPCTEAVTWFVFPKPLEVSKSDISKFFALKDSHGNPLVSNYRPIQPLGNRTIYFKNDKNEKI